MTQGEAWQILQNIRYKKLTIKRLERLFYNHSKTNSIGIGMKNEVVDIVTGQPNCLCQTVEIDLDVYDTEGKILKFVYDECIRMETHEAGEWFEYKGVRIYDPHLGEVHHNPAPNAVYAQWDAEKARTQKAIDFGRDYGIQPGRFNEMMQAGPNFHKQAEKARDKYFADYSKVEELAAANGMLTRVHDEVTYTVNPHVQEDFINKIRKIFK